MKKKNRTNKEKKCVTQSSEKHLSLVENNSNSKSLAIFSHFIPAFDIFLIDFAFVAKNSGVNCTGIALENKSALGSVSCWPIKYDVPAAENYL